MHMVVLRNQSKSMCYKCGVRGHLVRDCMSKKKDGESSMDSDPTLVVVEVQAF